MTLDQMVSALQWTGGITAGILLGLVGYFLRDAHVNIKNDLVSTKIDLAQKADTTVINSAFSMYRDDLRALEERHKDEAIAHREELRAVDERHKNEATRMERQYEVRFAGVVAQFSERINSMERNMSDKMDFMIKMIQQGRS